MVKHFLEQSLWLIWDCWRFWNMWEFLSLLICLHITTEGHKHLGAALGSRSYFEEHVGEKVEDWVSQVMKLAEFAVSQPQASYAAFTFGRRHWWTYFLRRLPDIADLLEPLERAISDVLIPALLEHQVTETERDLLALPVRMGGLGLVNPHQPVSTRIWGVHQSNRPPCETGCQASSRGT